MPVGFCLIKSECEINFPPLAKTLAAAAFEIENVHSVILCDIAPVPRTLPGNTTVSFSLVNSLILFTLMSLLAIDGFNAYSANLRQIGASFATMLF